MEVVAKMLWQEKQMKHIKQEMKYHIVLIADDMISFIANLKDSSGYILQ